MDKHPATQQMLALTPIRLFGMKTRSGEVGIEIETEGANLPSELQYHWDVKGDGSLRARHGTPYEYVLRNPVGREKVPEVLRYLNKKFVEAGAVPDYSYRTSVHVHVNAQTMTIKETLTWLSCYFIVEDLITEFCGAHRVGNRFCLRASDAEGIVGSIVQALVSGNVDHMTNATYRYAACNMSALSNFGSIEFRAMQGTNDPEIINRWVELLLYIRDVSRDFTSPRDVVEAFSRLGPRTFLQRIVPDRFFQDFQWHPNRDNSMWEGVRRIMDVAYCGTDWDHKVKTLIPKDTYEAAIEEPHVQRGDDAENNFERRLRELAAQLDRDQAPRPIPGGRGRIGMPAENLAEGIRWGDIPLTTTPAPRPRGARGGGVDRDR